MVNSINFEGHGATPIKAIILRSLQDQQENIAGIARELQVIGKKDRFDVFVQTPDNHLVGKDFDLLSYMESFAPTPDTKFPQDSISFLKSGHVLSDPPNCPYNLELANNFNRTIKNHTEKSINGGNYFIMDRDTVLIGQNELKYHTLSSIKKILEVKKVIPVPQGDYHIDLAIRPLNDGNILVADDRLTLKTAAETFRLIKSSFKSQNNEAPDFMIKPFKSLISYASNMIRVDTRTRAIFQSFGEDFYANASKIIKTLKENGLNPIPVPGRLYSTIPLADVGVVRSFDFNFMNSVVHQKADGSLSYITNKGNLDIFNTIFEKAFKRSVKEVIKPDDVHFISGGGYIPRSLKEPKSGGLHCMSVTVV